MGRYSVSISGARISSVSEDSMHFCTIPNETVTADVVAQISLAIL